MEKWTLNWLRESVRKQNHKELAKYLLHRHEVIAQDHLVAGWTVERILKEGFNIDRGATTVPEAAMKVLRNVPNVDPTIVWEIVRKSVDQRQIFEFGKLLLRLSKDEVIPRSPAIQAVAREVQDMITIQVVIDS